MLRERYQIADLAVDVDAVTVTRPDGSTVALPKLSFDLLVALARRAPAGAAAPARRWPGPVRGRRGTARGGDPGQGKGDGRHATAAGVAAMGESAHGTSWRNRLRGGIPVSYAVARGRSR
jgi:hypothetical protein